MIGKPRLEERALLERTAVRDESAFRLIYEAYQSQVLTFVFKYLKSRERAEEVMQETFLRLWTMGEKLLEINDLENYLLTIARNKAFDALRQLKREGRHVQAMSDGLDVAENVTEEKIILDDTRGVLEKGIALLPPQQQQVYRLCHQQGLKYEEAAQQLGIAPATVHRHMKLALAFLRKYLAEHTDLAVIFIILKLA